MKSEPKEANEANEANGAQERISRILEIVKGGDRPAQRKAKAKRDGRDRNGKDGGKTAGKDSGKDDRYLERPARGKGAGEAERRKKNQERSDNEEDKKVWIKKPDLSGFNAEAPEFLPSVLKGDAPPFVPAYLDPVMAGSMQPGYDAWYGFWPEAPVSAGDSDLPEVVPGPREGEYVGLQSIAEMGDWIVLREKKPKAKPFFWNTATGEKTWEAPPILQELGVAEILVKWSEDLGESGIEPSPLLRNPEPQRRRKEKKPPPGFAD